MSDATKLAQLETERALVEEASRTIEELHKQVSELRANMEYISDVLGSCAYFESKQVRRAWDKARASLAT